jgi:hypothetical protein|tara:strand:+ start:225 stop:395 length:171 start_codon:yes stop_codon:yes gene_type:complete
MSKEVITTETELRRVLNSPLIIPNSPDRARLSRLYEGRKDTKVEIKVTLKEEKKED